MKPFVKKVIVPALLVVLVWFTMSQHGGFVHRLLSYVYDLDYYLAEASEGQDYANDMAGQYWIPAGELLTVEEHYNITTFGELSWYESDADDGEILFMVVEITEESKISTNASAPGGYVHNHEIILVPEDTMYPTEVLRLKPLAGRRSIFDGGLHREFEQEFEQEVDYGSVSKLVMTYELH